ncbi:VanW family protein [Paenibacillus sp. sgz500958]|uniref:VanW family protein n=1 Tax=Paenibacillus sp. sgz500958 TaxID=3242475 RepID=UPI0036D37CFB
MKKAHIALIAGASLLLTLSLGFGALHYYSSQRTLPEGTVLAGWNVGGMDKDKVRTELEENITELHQLPLVLTADNNTELKLTLHEAGLSYEAEAFLQGLQKLEEGGLLDRVQARRNFPLSWSLNVHLDLTELQRRLSPTWEKETFGETVDATRRITENDRVVYTPGRTSRQVDWEVLEKSLQHAVPKELGSLEGPKNKGITVPIPLTVVQPEVTVKSLKQEGIERKIAQFSTTLGSSGPGRIYNVDSAAKAVDGTILPPGGIFDYGKAIEKARKIYGFREAPVIVNGKLQPGMGGGICQVSSTLYNAALRSGLEIVERRNHSLPVSYLPKGQDATFAEGYINFRFRNNTGKFLIIHAAVQNRTLTVKLFGTFPRNVTYRIESSIVETLTPPDKFIIDSSLSPGSSRILQSGKTGYIVETYITRMVDGQPVEKKKLSRDIYKAQKRLIAVSKVTHNRTTKPESTHKPFWKMG